MSSSTRLELSFAELDLPQFLQDTLNKVGYEKPSPIQQLTIPVLLQGKDVVGMAQTGTGKTAAFALPILAKIDLSKGTTQALVLCPTRELAIQVAEAFQTYAAGMRGFHVLPIYGGQDMGRQLSGLRRGAQVVVATPGRLLDHINRKTIDLTGLSTLVLDEADEMLRMGFIDDVETILENTPKTRQVALFSATMPGPIRSVAQKYLNNPQEIKIESAISTNEDIEQFYWLVQGASKLDALTRILEVEEFDAMIIFVRTKTSTVDLADKLSARGFAASPLNGDMNQAIRSRTVDQLKKGALDILVATDVAARGLDVDRLSHVMNYDIPYDDEAYVHRIGRTGRAGRSGKAILFVAPRERRLLASIEKTTRKQITRMELPTRGELIEKRSVIFKEGISEAIVNGKLDFFHKLVDDLVREHECTPEHVAAAMAYLLQKDRPLEPSGGHADSPRSDREGFAYGDSQNQRERPAKRSKDENKPAERTSRRERTEQRKPIDKEFAGVLSGNDLAGEQPRAPRKIEHNPADDGRAKPLRDYPDIPMERFRIHVGHKDGVTPREVVGAIANEAEIEGRYIGHIRIYDDYCTVDLPGGMPKEVMQVLQKTHVCSKPLNIEPITKSGHAVPSTQVRTPRPDRPKNEGFKKEGFKKEGFKKDREPRKESVQAEIKKPAPKKSADEASNTETVIAKPAKPKDEKVSLTDGQSKDITREVLERFPDLDASKPRAKPKASKAKVKNRTDKDKGKRRSPSTKPSE